MSNTTDTITEQPPTSYDLPDEVIDLILNEVTSQGAIVAIMQALPRMAAACYPDEHGARSLFASRLMGAEDAAELLGGHTFEAIRPHLGQVACGYPAIALAALRCGNSQLFDRLVAEGLLSTALVDLVNLPQASTGDELQDGIPLLGFDTRPTFPAQ